MKILALELSSARGSIARVDDGVEIFVSEFANDRKHSGLFFENLERCVEQFGHANRIVVGLGPGSYAGTRIAIATATGLSVATGAELIGLPSLCAIPTDDTEYAVIGDARRQTFFFARISNRRCIEGPTLFSQDDLLKRLDQVTIPVFSAEPLPAFSAAVMNFPAARILAQIAATGAANPSKLPLEPMYLRDPHITYPKAVAT